MADYFSFSPVAADPVQVFGPRSDGLTFDGRAPAGETVRVMKNGVEVGTAVVDAYGLWAYAFAEAPAEGDRIAVKVQVTSGAYLIPIKRISFFVSRFFPGFF
mgnify:CR=1 FL=1|jgi:hypothetical protein